MNDMWPIRRLLHGQMHHYITTLYMVHGLKLRRKRRRKVASDSIIAETTSDSPINLANYLYALMHAYSGFSNASHSRIPIKYVSVLQTRQQQHRLVLIRTWLCRLVNARLRLRGQGTCRRFLFFHTLHFCCSQVIVFTEADTYIVLSVSSR